MQLYEYVNGRYFSLEVDVREGHLRDIKKKYDRPDLED